jgi:chromosome segregation ATPase
MASGGGAPSTARPSMTPLQHRQSRWLGQEYADITKLREISAKHDKVATRFHQRAARTNTKIERLRHQATVLREKAQSVLAQIPEIEAEMGQHERDIKAHSERSGGVQIGSDVTALHYRVRKLQQKIVDKQHRARSLEHRAATKTQKTAELKIKVDRYLEQARLAEQEALSYRQRADRLQMATEGDVAARIAPANAGEANAPSHDHPRPQ